MSRKPQQTLAERRPDVWRRWRSHIQPGPDGCEVWTGSVHAESGTPRFHFHGNHPARHVALWMVGRHRRTRVQRLVTRCGNPLCVAVDHIVEVRVERRRTFVPRHVLTEDQKQEIIRLRHETTLTLDQIARKRGVHESTVFRLAGPRRPAKREAVAS